MDCHELCVSCRGWPRLCAEWPDADAIACDGRGMSQAWTSTMRSACCTAPSSTSAQGKAVPSCLLAESLSTCGLTASKSSRRSRCRPRTVRRKLWVATGCPALTAVPADVDYLMEWIDGQLSNASLFPVTPGAAGSARGSGCASRVRLALTPPLRPLARRGSLPTKVPEPRQSHL